MEGGAFHTGIYSKDYPKAYERRKNDTSNFCHSISPRESFCLDGSGLSFKNAESPEFDVWNNQSRTIPLFDLRKIILNPIQFGNYELLKQRAAHTSRLL